MDTLTPCKPPDPFARQITGHRRGKGMSVNQGLAIKSAVALAMIASLGMSRAPQSTAGTALKRIHDPGRVTYSIHIRSCRAQDHGKLPDRSCTPGSIDPAVTQRNIHSTICRAGWTAKVRPPAVVHEAAVRARRCAPTKGLRI